MFNVVGSFLDYLPTYKAYHQRILEELYEDNVMYLEMRTGMGGVSENFRSKKSHSQKCHTVGSMS